MVKIALTKFGMKPEEKKSTGKAEALAPDLRRAIAARPWYHVRTMADQNVLRAAGIDHSGAVFVTVPRDDLALNVVRSAHDMFPALPIVARVRYNLNVSALKRAGAIRVFCEEEHIAEELVQVLQEAAKYAKVSHADAGA